MIVTGDPNKSELRFHTEFGHLPGSFLAFLPPFPFL